MLGHSRGRCDSVPWAGSAEGGAEDGSGGRADPAGPLFPLRAVSSPAPSRRGSGLTEKTDTSGLIPRGLGAERLLFQGRDLGRLSPSKTCDTARERPARRRGHLLGMRGGGRGTIVGRGQELGAAVMTDTKPRDSKQPPRADTRLYADQDPGSSLAPPAVSLHSSIFTHCSKGSQGKPPLRKSF